MTLATELAAVSAEIFKIREKALTDKQIEQMTWRIWGYVFANPEGMDSEKHCRIIQAAIEGAVADVQARIEELAAELGSTRTKFRLRGQEIKDLKETIGLLKREKKELRSKLTNSLEKGRLRSVELNKLRKQEK